MNLGSIWFPQLGKPQIWLDKRVYVEADAFLVLLEPVTA